MVVPAFFGMCTKIILFFPVTIKTPSLINIKNSITLLDKISFISLTSLLIGIIGTVPGHELTHRKKEKFDMFIGNKAADIPFLKCMGIILWPHNYPK